MDWWGVRSNVSIVLDFCGEEGFEPKSEALILQVCCTLQLLPVFINFLSDEQDETMNTSC